MYRPTWAEVDLSAVRDNIKAIRVRVGANVRIMPAIKADGYGHGAVAVSKACLKAGADALCVACIEEAIILRNAGIGAPILILGCSTDDAAAEIVQNDITATVCNIEFARNLSDVAQKQHKNARVHVKVDTGMGRIGIRPEKVLEFVSELKSLPGLSVEGMFTHFPTSDETDRSFTLSQIETMRKLRDALKRQGAGTLMVHASNSAGILAFPEANFDAVRPGIMIYGCYPSSEVEKSVPIREAMIVKTRIVFLKESDAGTTISYGRTHALKRKSKVATLPIGYGDGYPRLLSNRGEAAIRGVRVPVIGRVCMDQIMVDVTDVPGVQVGDEVVLYGGGYDYLNMSRVAESIGTISYELFCNLGCRVPRIYLNE